MPCRHFFLCISILVFLVVNSVSAQDGLFPRVSREMDIDSPYTLILTGRNPALAERLSHAGRVVGLDGFRVSTLREFDYLRRLDAESNRPLRLHVVQGGTLKEILIDAHLIARGYDIFVYPTHDFSTALSEGGVDVTSLFKAVLGTEPAPSYMRRVLSRLPGVCQRQLTKMLNGSPKQKKWATVFLDTYIKLCFEKYDDASRSAEILMDDTEGAHPILAKILTFYSKVAQLPPTATEFPLALYGVSSQFAAFYYPYPIISFNVFGNNFSNDITYQQIIDARMSGSKTSMELAQATEAWRVADRGKFELEEVAELYVHLTKLALVNPDRHGGWPFRYRAVWGRRSRRDVLTKLRARLVAKPDERFITALCLVVLGTIDGSYDNIKLGNDQLLSLGSTETLLAYNLVSSSGYHWLRRYSYRRGRYMLQEAQRATSGNPLGLPPIYEYLRTHCPYYHYNGIYYLLKSSRSQPQPIHQVAKALEKALPCMRMEAMIDAGMLTADEEEARRAFEYSTLRLSVLPSPYHWKELLENHIFLSERMPLSTVFNSYMTILTSHLQNQGAGVTYINITQLFDAIRSRQNIEYPGQFMDIDNWGEAGPALTAKADTYFQESGSPLICLKLAEKLSNAGNHEDAKRYSRIATNCYLGLKRLYSYEDFPFIEYNSLDYQLLTELCAANGSGTILKELYSQENLKKKHASSEAAIYAFSLADQGYWTPAIRQLKNAFLLPGASAEPVRPDILFAGGSLPFSGHNFAEALANNWLTRPELRQKHKNEINALLNQWDATKNTAPLVGQTHVLYAVPAKDPVIIDGMLDEWDLSGKRTYGADLRYPLAESAQLALAYDDNALYLGIYFKDPTPMDNPSHPEQKELTVVGDSAIIRFRHGERSGTIVSWYHPSSQSEYRKPIFFETGIDPLLPEGGAIRDRYIKSDALGEFDVAYHTDTDMGGYTQELRIPWEKITGDAVKPNEEMQLCVQLNFGRSYGKTVFNTPFYANLREGVESDDLVGGNTENFGKLILSKTGGLRVTRQPFEQQLEIKSNRDLLVFSLDSAKASGLQFGGSQQALLIAGSDGKIQNRDLKDGRLRNTMPTTHNSLKAFTYAPTGNLFATSGSDGTVCIWKGTKCIQTLKGHSKSVWALAFSPKGDFLVSADSGKSIIFWDVNTGAKKTSFKVDHAARAVCFSPDGQHIAAGTLRGDVYIFSVLKGQPAQLLKGHTFSVQDLCYSSDGKTLYSASDDMSIIVWDATKGNKISQLNGHTAPITGLHMSSRGTLVSTSYDCTVREWDTKEKKSNILYKCGSPIVLMAYDRASDSIAFSTLQNKVYTGSIK